MRSLILAYITFFGDDIIIINIGLQLLVVNWLFFLDILSLLVLSELVSVLIYERMLLGLVGLAVDVDVEVLSNVFDVIELEWHAILPWLIILVIVLDIIHHVLVLIKWEILLIILEIAGLCI